MDYEHLKQHAKPYYPALRLEKVFPHRFRKWLKRFVVAILALLALGIAATYFFPQYIALIDGGNILIGYLPQMNAVVQILFGVWMFLFMIESFYYSYKFEGLPTILPERGLVRDGHMMTYEAASIFFDSQGKNLGHAFLDSPYGREIITRTGLSDTVFDGYQPTGDLIMLPDDTKMVDILMVAQTLITHDDTFAGILFREGVQEEEFLGAAEWVNHLVLERKRHERAWSRENLGRMPGLAKDWAYGQTYLLERFARPIEKTSAYKRVSLDSPQGKEDAEELEGILARSHESNAVLVGEEGSGKMDIIARLAKEIHAGTILPTLEHKKMFLLDGQSMIASVGEKAQFEQEMAKVLNQVARAGNIILVIENFPVLIQSAQTIGSDVASLLDPYISGATMQVIATANPDQYYRVIETNPKLVQRFDKVQIDDADESVTVRVLEDIAGQYEHRFRVFFTYQSLLTIARSAEQYFTSGIMPDKAIDLLSEMVPVIREKKHSIITKTDVLELVEAKTGIPTGEVQADEREILMNLEDRLHSRVVGQDEAIKGIANTMRRSRAGIQNPKRPMGSFLFLGPTGVGKTEVSKALAEQFFGNEEAITRFDMSEYNTYDALDKLIGSFQTGKVGTLVTAIKERPYGLLLLDEFEKSTDPVKDLFLQILDEGVFSDMHGKRINARNTIIIATSNAGAQHIWEYFQRGEDVTIHKKELIDEIITAGIYKPELINRFDGTVIFHPLDRTHLVKIAGLMVERLQKRLMRKGIELVLGPDVIEYIANQGSDPQFGARPMNRFIQETVEQAIANKVIMGSTKTGSTLEITREELEVLVA